MFQNLTGWHALIVLAVVLLIFGAAKLPALARSFGQSVRIIKDEVRADAPDPSVVAADAATTAADPAATPATRPVALTPTLSETRAS